MTREELRDYVDEQRALNNIPYHVYSALIDGIDTPEQEPYEDKRTDKRTETHACDCISRHSAWVYCEDEAGHDGFRCEKCNTFYPWYYEYYYSADDFISDYNFCPNCGARMEEGSDTE